MTLLPSRSLLLEKKLAGYENSVKNVHPTSWHTVCVYNRRHTKYIIDNAITGRHPPSGDRSLIRI